MIVASGSSGSARCSTTTGSATDSDLGAADRGGARLARAAPLPETAREQVTVALQVIDALDRQTARDRSASCEPTRAARPAARR